MIKEQYVSSETAKLLREKGFPIGHPEVCTQALVIRWLREVHNCLISIEIHSITPKLTWCYKYRNTKKGYYRIRSQYKTYEEACEAAIQYCLKELIC